MTNYLKAKNKVNKYERNEALHSELFKNCFTQEEIKQYVETRKLKIFVKSYNFSKKYFGYFSAINKLHHYQNNIIFCEYWKIFIFYLRS
jgi:hypothetical protein